MIAHLSRLEDIDNEVELRNPSMNYEAKHEGHGFVGQADK